MLVCNGGAGRISLELLRNCDNLDLTQTETSQHHYHVLRTLLEDSVLTWKQPLEGQIVETREYRLSNSERDGALLEKKRNNIKLTHSNIGKNLISYL